MPLGIKGNHSIVCLNTTFFFCLIEKVSHTYNEALLLFSHCSPFLKSDTRAIQFLNAIHYSPLKITFIPMPLFQNLCLYWQVFSPDQQTINMTPLNAHILTPKINHVLFSSSRHMGPTRTVYRSCSLTTGTFRSQSTNTDPCTHIPALCNTPRQQRRAILRSTLGTTHCWLTSGLWINRCQSWPSVGPALPCLSLLLLVAGQTHCNRE